MRHQRWTIAAVAVAAMATIGGLTIATAAGTSSTTSPHSTVSVSVATAPAGTGAATIQTETATVQGKTETILVDASGLPLYTYRPDTVTTSRVSGQLAALWPPLVSNAPTANGATGQVTAVATTNGQQVAYNGHFLYTFVEDKPGHVTGQGVQNFFVATPSLSGGAAKATTSGSGNGNSYGY
jgi:predicted lipoprotein with Yx(FWY)xxD motif